MKTITFQIHRGDSFISKTIMKLSNGRFSHVSVDFEGVTYESVEGEGFRSINTLALSGSPIVERYAIKVSDRKFYQLKDWSENQVGKGYDYTGVFSHMIPLFLKPNMGKWYCSEYAFVLLNKISGILGDDSGQHKVSPQVLRDILRLKFNAKRV